MQGSGSTGSGRDVFGAPNAPKGPMHAANGASLTFGHGALKKLCRSKDEALPAGAHLLKESQEEIIDYYTEHEWVEEVASQIEKGCCRARSLVGGEQRKLAPLKGGMLANNTTNRSNNTDEVIGDTKKCTLPTDSLTKIKSRKKRKPSCGRRRCTHGCASNNLSCSGTISRIMGHPPPLLANASKRKQKIFLMKQLICQEQAEQLGRRRAADDWAQLFKTTMSKQWKW